MNHIPGFRPVTTNMTHKTVCFGRAFIAIAVMATTLCGCGVPTSEAGSTAVVAPALLQVQAAAADSGAAAEAKTTYEIEYVVTPDPAAGGASITLKLNQQSYLLREIDMRAPASQFGNFSGDGDIEHDGERMTWRPPQAGGELHWFAKINHQRNGKSYDAYQTSDWAIFRAEDVIPQAASKALRGATSDVTLSFDLPRGWSSVTEYFGRNDRYRIIDTDRRFDRPAGWILVGKIGVRKDEIANVRVTVAAPVSNGFRRMDILAMLGWTLPEIVRIVPHFPQRLTIIGASDPMWRGGLSGPRSIFIHSDRPMLSENSTSTLIHEVMHIAIGGGAGAGSDWIVEGLAEYYGLVILRRTGTITDNRYLSSLKRLEEWGQESDLLCADRSSGPVTARAVALFSDLDDEIRRTSSNKFSLDDVMRALAKAENAITLVNLKSITSNLLGSNATTLSQENLPGCNI